MVRWIILMLSLLQAASVLSTAQTPPATDTPEPGSVEAIAAATGDKHFLSPWVSYLPQSATVPSPARFLGRIPGAPGEFVDSSKPYAYCPPLPPPSPPVPLF